MTVSQEAAAYTMRAYEPSDEDGVLRLLRLSLGDGASFTRNADFWRWKHFHNPFGASQLLLAAGAEVWGLRAFMRWVFRTPAGRVRAVRAVDTATHPGVRRLGIFSGLTRLSLDRARADGVHLVFNTPNPQSMAGYLKLGWHLVGRPRLLIRPLNPARIASVKLLKRGAAAADAVDLMRAPLPPVEDLLARPGLEGLLEEDDGLRGDGIRTERTMAFLRWRYASLPSPRYFTLVAGDGLRAAAILRPNVRQGLREIMLSEVLISSGGAAAVRALMGRLARHVRADYVVAAAAPQGAHWRMLRGAGFLPLPAGAGPNFTVFPLAWPLPSTDPAGLESWRLSLGDLEIF